MQLPRNQVHRQMSTIYIDQQHIQEWNKIHANMLKNHFTPNIVYAKYNEIYLQRPNFVIFQR